MAGGPIWQEPVRGGPTDLAVLGLPGVDALWLQLEGVSPAPPAARLTGRRLVSVEPGRVTCGQVEVGDGEIRRFRTGEVVLVEDTAGTGHLTTVLGTEDSGWMFVPLAPETGPRPATAPAAPAAPA